MLTILQNLGRTIIQSTAGAKLTHRLVLPLHMVAMVLEKFSNITLLLIMAFIWTLSTGQKTPSYV